MVGLARYGRSALWAAAIDEQITLAAIHQGLVAYPTCLAQPRDWWTPALHEFEDSAERLPVAFSCVVAALAGFRRRGDEES